VDNVVLYVAVQVSRVTMILDASMIIEGASETRIAWNGGGWLEARIWAGSGGTVGASSDVEFDREFDFIEDRRLGEFGGGGGVRTGRGGVLLPGLSGSNKVSSSVSGSGSGRGGNGGLVGGEMGSVAEASRD